jgi:hypothetical protein
LPHQCAASLTEDIERQSGELKFVVNPTGIGQKSLDSETAHFSAAPGGGSGPLRTPTPTGVGGAAAAGRLLHRRTHFGLRGRGPKQIDATHAATHFRTVRWSPSPLASDTYKTQVSVTSSPSTAGRFMCTHVVWHAHCVILTPMRLDPRQPVCRRLCEHHRSARYKTVAMVVEQTSGRRANASGPG